MMINLNDLPTIRKLDAHDFVSHINALPDQIEFAWELGQSLSLPAMEGLRNIVIAGVGTSALSADLLAAYAAPHCLIPITVQREYDLPAWARERETLMIVCSYSGDTEESLSVFEQACARNCRMLVITTGGMLAKLGEAQGCPVWMVDSAGQTRTSPGFFFALLLAMLFRLSLLPDPAADLNEALHAMRNVQTNLLPEVPVAHNPAKRLAGQLVGRGVAVYAADYLVPVARRWKCQIAELAKAWSQYDPLPEMNHNSLAGINNPESVLMQTIALFLVAPANHERNRLRLNLTRQVFMTQGINTDAITARGEGPLAHIWSMMLFGDYTAYYLALAYGEDPARVEIFDLLQKVLIDS
jgi:glucose/mannose-6-phosphate isomerase